MGLLAVAVIAATGKMGHSVSSLFCAVSNTLGNVVGSAGTCTGSVASLPAAGPVAGAYSWAATIPSSGASLQASVLVGVSTGTGISVTSVSGAGATLSAGAITFVPSGIPMTGSAPSAGSFQYTVTDSSGKTASNTVTVTLGACAGGEAAGTVCTKSSQTVVSAGSSFYVWPANDASTTWNNGSSNWVQVFGTEPTVPGDMNGSSETATLVALGTTTSPAPYAAAQECNNHGSGVWYLPAQGELAQVYTNETAINAGAALVSGGGSFTASFYWSASESSYVSAWVEYLGSGGGYGGSVKYNTYAVRCARR